MNLKLNNKRELSRAFALVTQIGLNMFICVFIGLYIGKSLDGIFKTSPLFLLIFTLIGVFAAFFNMYKIAMKHVNKVEKTQDINKFSTVDIRSNEKKAIENRKKIDELRSSAEVENEENNDF